MTLSTVEETEAHDALRARVAAAGDDDLLTAEEIAIYMRVSYWQVKQLARREEHRLPLDGPPRTRRITKRAARAWMAQEGRNAQQ